MSRRMRIYYYAVLGAMGGLIGWQLSNILGLSFSSLIYLSDLIVGALIGLSIGLMIGIAEGLLTRNPVHALRAGFFGGALGFVAGAVGLPLAEFAFQVSGGGAAARAVELDAHLAGPLDARHGAVDDVTHGAEHQGGERH